MGDRSAYDYDAEDRLVGCGALFLVGLGIVGVIVAIARAVS